MLFTEHMGEVGRERERSIIQLIQNTRFVKTTVQNIDIPLTCAFV